MNNNEAACPNPADPFFSHHDRARTLDAIAALRRGLVTV